MVHSVSVANESSPQETPSIKGLARCALGAAAFCLVVWALIFWVPWSAMADHLIHGLEGLADLIQNSPLMRRIGHALLVVVFAILWVLRLPLWAVVMHPVALAVWAFLALMACCTIRRYQAVAHPRAQSWVGGSYNFLFVTIVYVLLGTPLVSLGWENQINDRGAAEPFKQFTGLRAPMLAMNQTPTGLSFEDRVAAANQRAAVIAEEGSDDAQPITLVSAQRRIIALSASLNVSTCRALADPSARFVPKAINGIVIHKLSEVAPACIYGWDNKVSLETKPGEWAQR